MKTLFWLGAVLIGFIGAWLGLNIIIVIYALML